MGQTCGGVIIEKSKGGFVMAKLIIADTSTKIIDDNNFINITINEKITDVDILKELAEYYGKMYENLEVLFNGKR